MQTNIRSTSPPCKADSCVGLCGAIHFRYVAGNCAYASLADTTMTQDPDASSGYISDVSTCWSLCLQLRVGGEECVAAVLETTTICKLYVGTEELRQPQLIATAASAGSTVMLRTCFQCKHT